MIRKMICVLVMIIMLFTVIFPSASALVDNATVQELEELYDQHNYTELISKTKNLLENNGDDPAATMYLGLAYASTQEYILAIPYLEAAINGAQESECKAESEYALGLCCYMTDDCVKSKSCLNDCIALKATADVTARAQDLYKAINYDDYFDDWIVVCSEHIRYHFHPSFTQIQRDWFIQTRDDAYKKINQFFKSSPLKSIDFYVWDSDKSAESVLGQSLGFSIPQLAVINSLYGQTKGHELTHVLSYWMYPQRTKSAFIDEGTATYFNLLEYEEEPREAALRSAVQSGEIASFDIKYLWANATSSSSLTDLNENSYTIAASFIRYLIKEGGKDKFKELMKNQTYDNAKAIYGDELDQYISDFTALYQPKSNTDKKSTFILYIIFFMIILVLLSIIVLLHNRIRILIQNLFRWRKD